MSDFAKETDEGLVRARQAAVAENHLLTGATWEAILALSRGFVPHRLREYGKLEFFACVDENGERLAIPDEVRSAFGREARKRAELRAWFREEGGTLLPARWLCHAVGLRHGTAHLLLVTADERADVLVQLRAMSKLEAPGCIDLPVAGHVDGLQSYEETLRKEAREEIALDVDELVELEERGGYCSTSYPGDGQLVNVEYHRAYTAKIRRDHVARLKSDPGEVAAVFLLARDELMKLIAAYPERFAGGIKDTLKHFLL